MTASRPSLAGIGARADAATEGPWEVGEAVLRDGRRVIRVGSALPNPDIARLHPSRVSDAEFIAHARTDVPALVAALDAVLEFAGANADEDLLDLIAQHLDLEDQ